MKKQTCKGTHSRHICVLVSEKKFDKISKLSAGPEFICFNCGRVAKSRTNLCNPEAMNQGKK